jgi:alginate O-acetyltransferase complex protein AlgI
VAGLLGILVVSRLPVFQAVVFPSEQGNAGQWVGLSYLIFRLIHVIVDSDRLGAIPVGTLNAYALFPPALLAGPIHRANQFLPQLAQPRWPASRDRLIDCLWRISIGIIKKLVLANALSLIALNVNIATNPAASRGLLLVSLIAFAFMLYFDFAGYSDIAIGVAGLFGITLPENFANPYAQTSIARFWQTWHMSLSFWLRDYVFFPLSRTLLSRFGRRWTTPIMAIAHLTTMITAGLWHGFTSGFLTWGIWHGLGLFANAQWSMVLKQREWKPAPILGTAVTFAFVLIGWVFFALPTFNDGIYFLMRLVTG